MQASAAGMQASQASSEHLRYAHSNIAVIRKCLVSGTCWLFLKKSGGSAPQTPCRCNMPLEAHHPSQVGPFRHLASFPTAIHTQPPCHCIGIYLHQICYCAPSQESWSLAGREELTGVESFLCRRSLRALFGAGPFFYDHPPSEAHREIDITLKCIGTNSATLC